MYKETLQLLTTQQIPTTSSPPPPILITFFVTRSPNITEAEFHNHWSTHHGPLVTPWLKRSGVLEYNQVCRTSHLPHKSISLLYFSTLSNLLSDYLTPTQQFHAPSSSKKAVIPLSDPGSPIASYDGYAEFLVPSVQVFQAAFKDPFYAKEVAPDENYLFDKSAFAVSAGYREVFV